MSKFKNLYLAGMQAAFKYVNIDEVMLMEVKAAESIYKNLSSNDDGFKP